MKKFQFHRQAILIVSTITLLAAGCSKDKSVVSEKAARINAFDNSVRQIDPNYQQFGAVKGYVLPADARAIISLTNLSDGSFYSVAADDNGLFAMEKIPTASYTMKVFPTNPAYQGVQLDVIVVTDQTTEVTITLSKMEK